MNRTIWTDLSNTDREQLIEERINEVSRIRSRGWERFNGVAEQVVEDEAVAATSSAFAIRPIGVCFS